MWRDLEPDHIVGHVGRLIINDCQSLTLIFLYDNELSSRVLFKKNSGVTSSVSSTCTSSCRATKKFNNRIQWMLLFRKRFIFYGDSILKNIDLSHLSFKVNLRHRSLATSQRLLLNWLFRLCFKCCWLRNRFHQRFFRMRSSRPFFITNGGGFFLTVAFCDFCGFVFLDLAKQSASSKGHI